MLTSLTSLWSQEPYSWSSAVVLWDRDNPAASWGSLLKTPCWGGTVWLSYCLMRLSIKLLWKRTILSEFWGGTPQKLHLLEEIFQQKPQGLRIRLIGRRKIILRKEIYDQWEMRTNTRSNRIYKCSNGTFIFLRSRLSLHLHLNWALHIKD